MGFIFAFLLPIINWCFILSTHSGNSASHSHSLNGLHLFTEVVSSSPAKKRTETELDLDYIDVVMSHLTYDSLFGLQMDTNNNIKMQGKKIIGNIGYYLYSTTVLFRR